MAIKFIETPQGWVKQHVFTTGPYKGKVVAQLEWNPGFRSMLEENHNNAQDYLSSEVLRTSNKFAPVVTSMLVKSGILGTQAGTGEVAWIAPYAWRQYHLAERKTSQNTNKPNGGPYWFERAWKIFGKNIITNTERMIGRGL